MAHSDLECEHCGEVILIPDKDSEFQFIMCDACMCELQEMVFIAEDDDEFEFMLGHILNE